MKTNYMGWGIVVILLTAVGGWSFQNGQPSHFSQNVSSLTQPESQVSGTVFAEKDGIIAIDLAGNQTKDQIAVIDPKTRSLATYQIDRNTGEINLKSVRKIHWDLQLDDYNGLKPSPQTIRSAVLEKLNR